MNKRRNIALIVASVFTLMVWSLSAQVASSFTTSSSISVVQNAEELKAAFKQAKGGEIIRLAPGDYGLVKLWNKQFFSPVMLISANPKKPAHISRIDIGQVQNLLLKNVNFGSKNFENDKMSRSIIRLIRCDGIKIENIYLTGDRDISIGVLARDSSNVVIQNSKFREQYRGISFFNSQNVKVLYSDFKDIRSDGITSAGVSDIEIAYNYMRDFYYVDPDHPDGIQFWTGNASKAATNINIHDNVILQGKGRGTQGIFMRDEAKNMPYENVTIRNNLIYQNRYWHGIALFNAGKSVAIENNTVISAEGDRAWNWIWLGKVEGAIVRNNVADEIHLKNSHNVKMIDNVDLKKRPKLRKLIPDIDAGISAVPSRLSYKGNGYQPSQHWADHP